MLHVVRPLTRIAGLAVGLVVLTAPPASADAAGPSDFRSEVTEIVPAVEGIEATIRGGDSFLEITRRRRAHGARRGLLRGALPAGPRGRHRAAQPAVPRAIPQRRSPGPGRHPCRRARGDRRRRRSRVGDDRGWRHVRLARPSSPLDGRSVPACGAGRASARLTTTRGACRSRSTARQLTSRARSPTNPPHHRCRGRPSRCSPVAGWPGSGGAAGCDSAPACWSPWPGPRWSSVEPTGRRHPTVAATRCSGRCRSWLCVAAVGAVALAPSWARCGPGAGIGGVAVGLGACSAWRRS